MTVLNQAELAAAMLLRGGAEQVDLRLASSPIGGDSYDSTSRVVLESYQRPQFGPWGEVIRAHNLTPQAKTMFAWYHPVDPSAPWDPVTNPIHTSADVWIGAHYAAQDDEVDTHGHWSLEVPDAGGQLRSRFGIDFIDQVTKQRGVDKTRSYFANTDLSHAQGDGAIFRIHSGQGSAERIIEFNAYGNTGYNSPGYIDPNKRRWHLTVDQATESGGNAGSDFLIRRFADDGTAIGTLLYGRRSTGNVTLGELSSQGARLALRWAGASVSHGLLTYPDASPNSGYAHWGARAVATTDRVLDCRVGGDANSRFRFIASGGMEWGNGTDAPDTSLSRSGAGILTTPGDLTIGSRLRLTNTASAGYVEWLEQGSTPPRPAANGVRVFAQDNGAGKTQLVALFETGSLVVLATEP